MPRFEPILIRGVTFDPPARLMQEAHTGRLTVTQAVNGLAKWGFTSDEALEELRRAGVGC